MKKIIILMVLTMLTETALSKESGGGTVVGNGAGIVESNFQMAYINLQKIIYTCLETKACRLDRDERKIANDIENVLKINLEKKDRLIFLSEKAHPGFFTTGVSEAYRISKTQLAPNSPIYVNTDMLYDKEGYPTLNFEGVIRILIHELGHQTGVENHGALDILGTKIANFSEDITNYYSYKMEEESEKIFFAITNFNFPIKTSTVMFNWKNSYSQDLSTSILTNVECRYDSESYAGIEIFNGHFSIDEKGQLSFNAWIKLSCYESFSTLTNLYKKNLKIVLDHDLAILELLVF